MKTAEGGSGATAGDEDGSDKSDSNNDFEVIQKDEAVEG